MIALATSRLVLRPWAPSDLAPFAALCADPEVMRYIGDGSTRSPGEVQAAIERDRQCWSRHGWGLLAIEHLDTQEFIGFCGLAEPDFLPPLRPSVEIGWRLARDYWGQGFGTEAAAAVVDWAFTFADLERVIAVVQLDNLASHRVVEKLGMRREQRTIVPGHGVWVDVYALEADGWLGAR